MSVNEDIGSSYHTAAASNTPDGLTNIGTNLDDHIRDIKKNIRILSDSFTSQTFISADAADALFVTVGTTFTADHPLSATGTFQSGVTIGHVLAPLISATYAGTYLVNTIDPWGHTLAFTGVSSLTASRAEVASGISTTKYLTPDSQGYGVPAAKGWIGFDGSGTISSTTSYLSFNVANCYRSAQGVYVVSWANTFTTDRYPAIATTGLGVSGNTLTIGSSTTTTTFFKFKLVTSAAGVAQDSNRINVVAYGVWA